MTGSPKAVLSNQSIQIGCVAPSSPPNGSHPFCGALSEAWFYTYVRFFALEDLVRDLPLPVVLLGWDLKAKFRNRSGLEICAAWRNGGIVPVVKSERAELPEEVLAACSEMKAEWRKSLANHNLRRSATERTIAHIRAPISANVRMTARKVRPWPIEVF
jgi:hypothetical protein